ncbi:MAG: aldose epimerase family protein, partial [Candidatus Halalkalibacterium sp. M3_1C_030]
MSQELKVADFQTKIEGKKTDLFFLENRHGVRAAVTNYGARLVAIWVPDSNGEPDNIIAGYDTLAGYLNHDEAYLGAMVGRYANRIKDAAFKLGDKNYSVRANEGKHHIHGGEKGFHNTVWQAQQKMKNSLNLKLWSEDGKEGFPGNVEVNVNYRFNEDDELIIETEATTDRDT